jgi:hypothetical protein
LYLIFQALGGIVIFGSIWLFFTLLFSLLYTAALVTPPGKDNDHKAVNEFPEASDFSKIFMMTLSSSIGDLTYPDANFWIDSAGKNYGASLVMMR